MSSDNRNSRQDKIEHLLRISQGMTPQQAAADLATEYELKPHEMEAADAFVSNPPLPQYKTLKGVIAMALDHPRQEVAMAVIMKAWGITDEQMYYGFIRQLTNAVSKDEKADINELNTAIAMVAGIQPRDHLEAMLAVQMATVHIAALRHQRLMLTSDTIERLDIHERTVNKLMRTFTSQMEALRSIGTAETRRLSLSMFMSTKAVRRSSEMSPTGGGAEKERVRNSMNKLYPYQLAPRCSATSRRTGCPCQAPAERGKRVCRFHGARAGAPKGKRNGAYKHGRYTCEMIALRKEIADIGRRHRELIDLLG